MSTEESPSFPCRLRAERQRLRMTQLELAIALRIPASTYRSYEAGRTQPHVETLSRLGALGADIHWLVMGRSLEAVAAEVVPWERVHECSMLIRDWALKHPGIATLEVQASFLRVACAMLAADRNCDVESALRGMLPRAA